MGFLRWLVAGCLVLVGMANCAAGAGYEHVGGCVGDTGDTIGDVSRGLDVADEVLTRALEAQGVRGVRSGRAASAASLREAGRLSREVEVRGRRIQRYGQMLGWLFPVALVAAFLLVRRQQAAVVLGACVVMAATELLAQFAWEGRSVLAWVGLSVSVAAIAIVRMDDTLGAQGGSGVRRRRRRGWQGAYDEIREEIRREREDRW